MNTAEIQQGLAAGNELLRVIELKPWLVPIGIQWVHHAGSDTERGAENPA